MVYPRMGPKFTFQVQIISITHETQGFPCSSRLEDPVWKTGCLRVERAALTHMDDNFTSENDTLQRK
ncbi:hypothetical protein GJ496_000776 [Pomphorhynchus laevis]|nr:hypothetical protein GJ496_000776 [Pomphorhynchus laevis]